MTTSQTEQAFDNKISRYANPECEDCLGEGLVLCGDIEIECVCVSTGRNEAFGEMLMELAN